MKYKKLIIAVLCLSIMGIGFNSSSAQAMSLSDIQALAQQLQQTVFQLQQQLISITSARKSTPSAPVKLCLSSNLSYGMTSSQVRILQEGLKRDPSVFPPYPGQPAVSTGHFGPLTKAAVIRFQNKYAPEILTPWGRTIATGIVDIATRSKFNKLYCYNTTYNLPPTTTLNQEFTLEGIVTFQIPPLYSYKEFRLATCPDLKYPYIIRYDNNTKIFEKYATGGIHYLDNLNTGDLYIVKGIKTEKIDSACSNMIVYTATSIESATGGYVGPDRGYCQD